MNRGVQEDHGQPFRPRSEDFVFDDDDFDDHSYVTDEGMKVAGNGGDDYVGDGLDEGDVPVYDVGARDVVHRPRAAAPNLAGTQAAPPRDTAQPSANASPLPQTRPSDGFTPGAAFQPIPAQPTPAQHSAPPQRGPADGVRMSASGATDVGQRRQSTEQGVRAGDFDLTDVLAQMLERNASDAHLTSGAAPTIRVRGELIPLDDYDKLTGPELQRVLYALLTSKQREKFEEHLELDFAYSLPGRARFRVNIFRQRESMGAVFRTIPYDIMPLEKLGIPPVVGKFASLPRGLVLVTGPTGSGKSTTLAAVIDQANRTRHDHIMTVEDPIEFLHNHKGCLVNQREVGEDTHSFAAALKHVLRQDPDIILVGEMRDLETISVALTAAETGHLVFGTLHTQDAAQTIDRVIDVFPSEQQEQIRVMLAGSIQGVVCQTLCKTADGRSRVAATEVMLATPAIRNLIREGKTHQIYSAMQAGAQHGMHTLDQHLAELVRTNRVTYEVGLEKCHHVEDYNRLTGRA